MTNKSGPSIDTWGTPELIKAKSDVFYFMIVGIDYLDNIWRTINPKEPKEMNN